MRRTASFWGIVAVAAICGAACGSNDSLDLSTGTTPPPSGTLSPTPTPTVSPTGTPGATTSGTATGTSIATTLATPSAAGDVIAIAVGWTGAGTASVTDDKGNSYAQAGTPGVSAGGRHLAIYYAANATAGASVVTFHLSVAGLQSIVAQTVSGRATLNTLNDAAHAAGTGTIPNSGSVTATDTLAVLFGAEIHDGSATTSAGGSFSLVGIASDAGLTDVALGAEKRTLPTSGASSATFSLSASNTWVAAVAVFAAP